MKSAEAIKSLRKLTGMNQTDFGKAIGVGKMYVSKMERGKRGVTIDTFEKYCKSVGVQFILELKL